MRDIFREIPDIPVYVTSRPSAAGNGYMAEAMANGAAGCMTKPIHDSYAANLDYISGKVRELLDLAVNRKKCGIKAEYVPLEKKDVKRGNGFTPDIVLIAVSTGGPAALETILQGLPGNFPVPVLIVQHMPQNFIQTLAAHLDHVSSLHVKVAESMETVRAGTVYIANGGYHMKLNAAQRIRYDSAPPVNGIKPAADVLFKSVADSYRGSGVLAVILTGMGNDGTMGLTELKDKRNCRCIAQSEGTCVVYGMPQAVVAAGLADSIMDLGQIADEMVRLVSGRGAC
jgi:two-component system chemotaxis response regulator CheB